MKRVKCWWRKRCYQIWVCVVLLELWVRSLLRPGVRQQQKVFTFDFVYPPLFFRYQLTLAIVLLHAGYRVQWVMRPGMFARSVEFRSLWRLLTLLRIRWLLRSPADAECSSDCVLLTDQWHPRAGTSSRQVVGLDCVVRNTERGSVMMPFWGHPEFLLHRAGEFPRGSFDTSIRVSFVGNCDASSYSMFGAIPRARAKQVICQVLGDDVVSLGRWEDKSLLGSVAAMRILFVDRSELGLTVAEYAAVLRRSIFFLVLPGIESYVTHSLHECLSMGCVPVLALHGDFGDGWIDGVNCLTYEDEDALCSCLRTALNLTEEQCSLLQQGASEQLRRHFSLDRFANTVAGDDVSKILVCNV